MDVCVKVKKKEEKKDRRSGGALAFLSILISETTRHAFALLSMLRKVEGQF